MLVSFRCDLAMEFRDVREIIDAVPVRRTGENCECQDGASHPFYFMCMTVIYTVMYRFTSMNLHIEFHFVQDPAGELMGSALPAHVPSPDSSARNFSWLETLDKHRTHLSLITSYTPFEMRLA